MNNLFKVNWKQEKNSHYLWYADIISLLEQQNIKQRKKLMVKAKFERNMFLTKRSLEKIEKLEGNFHEKCNLWQNWFSKKY